MLYVSPLKALAVDVERNLRAPLVGIARPPRRPTCRCTLPIDRRFARATRRSGPGPIPAPSGGHPDHHARVAVPAADVERARRRCASLETVIVDEIHCAGADQARRAPGAVARAARGARRRRRCSGSACRRRSGRSTRSRDSSAASTAPAARTPATRSRSSRDDEATPERRGRRCQHDIHDEFAVGPPPDRRDFRPGDDRRRRRPPADQALDRSAGRGHVAARPGRSRSRAARRRPTSRASIWTAIHPRLVELIRAHRSTLIFVNSRRLAERLAAAINELAGETHRALASRLARARTARRDRGSAQGRHACRR